MATKKACRGTLSLVEAASYMMTVSSFTTDFSIVPRILRGNTRAPYKLLLHASNKSIALKKARIKKSQAKSEKLWIKFCQS